MASDATDRIEHADVEIGAFGQADSVRFGCSPDAEVRFRGDPERDAASRSERENLPDEIEPGVTYREVRVRWRATARSDHDLRGNAADDRDP
jgi:hypothetical protein